MFGGGCSSFQCIMHAELWTLELSKMSSRFNWGPLVPKRTSVVSFQKRSLNSQVNFQPDIARYHQNFRPSLVTTCGSTGAILKFGGSAWARPCTDAPAETRSETCRVDGRCKICPMPAGNFEAFEDYWSITKNLQRWWDLLWFNYMELTFMKHIFQETSWWKM